MTKALAILVPLGLMLVGLPLVGIIVIGKPLAPYLRFPPTTVSVDHLPFSWWVFCLLAVLVITALLPFVYRVIRKAKQATAIVAATTPFPWWGWLGATIVVVAWVLAWNRFSWFAAWQAFTFSPLWLGYILVINALTHTRTGHCLLRDRPGYFVSLFPLSAGFWWFFEYLNRFVQSWYYVGISDFGPWEYFLYTTLPFATVLPAVLSTCDWLASFPRLNQGLADAWPIRIMGARWLAWTMLLIAGAGLTAIGVWPEYMFSFLWVAPLVIITALQVICGRKTIFAPVATGDWRRLWQATLAALVCGFFWELWNYQSLAHWEYSIPFVHRFEIFHMPLLGYAGYLPFGWECLAAASLLHTVWPQQQ